MKNKQKQLLNTIIEAADARESYITEFLNGGKGLSDSTRARSYRFEGNITLRDALRVQAFLSDIAYNNRINTTRFYQLQDEIPAFSQAITNALVCKIENYINA